MKFARKLAARVWPFKPLIEERNRLRKQLAACDCFPVPPPHLRFRIGADTSLDKFLGIGRTLLGDIKILAGKAGREFDSFESILDFGCGCGRVARYLSKVTGTDIDPEAIAWCRENLPGTFDVNDSVPPLKYTDSSFDLIYAISVFTHLPEDLAMRWLEEMRRILRPGGLIVTSTIGESDLRGLVPDAWDEFQQRGFYYTTRFTTEGLPSFYGLTFHTRQYIETNWSRSFHISVFHPKAINNHQDGIVLTRQ